LLNIGTVLQRFSSESAPSLDRSKLWRLKQTRIENLTVKFLTPCFTESWRERMEASIKTKPGLQSAIEPFLAFRKR
jgi:Mg/Co/Ni transporter MgtE